MSGVNKVILVGNVGKDPEVRYLENNVAVAKFSLATTESYKDKSGNKVDHTEWHNIVLWRGLAEVAEKYVRKGHKLYIEGRLRTRQYGEDNNKKYFTDVQADNMVMLTPRGDNAGFPSTPPPDIAARTNAVSESEVPLPASNGAPTDDLPF